MDRRAFLGAVAAGAAAGCLGGGSDEQSLSNHAAARDISDLPTLGPDPAEAPGVIVAFEDPSCPTCRRFETGAFPKIRANLVEPGKAAFVYRAYPVVYEWGKPAVQALAATYVRDPGAFWALKEHYYARQDTFTVDNVLDRTESFLTSETAVDAAGVVADAREKRYDDRIQRNLAAGEDAGASATPTCYLFSDGAFVTEVVGAKPYSVYRDALGA